MNKLNISNILKFTDQMSDAIDRSTAVAEFDTQGHFVNANDNFLKIFGYTLNEVQGQHHSLLVTDEIKNSVAYKSFWNELGQGRFVAGEFERIDRLGDPRWINGSYNPVIVNGKIKTIIKFAVDITKQKQLSLSLEQQHRAIDKSNAVAIFDSKGNILQANENFCSIFSYEVEELAGHHHEKLLFEEDQNLEYKQFWEDLARGSYKRGEFRRRSRLGKEIWIRGSYNPIFDSYGKVYKVMKFALNVTEEKKIFNNYANQLKAIDRSNAIIEFDSTGHIIGVNENFLSIFGYTEQELLHRHHRVLVWDEEKDSEEYKDFWKSLSRGQYRTGEFRRQTRLGEEVWIRGSYNPIFDHKNEVEKIIKFALDVTENKRTQEELVKEQVMLTNQSKLAALGQMAAGVAHEVNNPLAIAQVNLEEAIEIIEDVDNDELLSHVQTAYNSAERISKIIKSLKKYASQDEKSRLEYVDIHASLEALLDVSRSLFAKKKVTIVNDLSYTQLLCDETGISQVFMNLINNAIHAMTHQSSEKKITIKEVFTHDSYIIRVQDTGPGIGHEDEEKIFNPFYTTKGPNGTGLGLSLSSQILKQNNAQLKFNPLVGRSCFDLVFPLESLKKISEAANE